MALRSPSRTTDSQKHFDAPGSTGLAMVPALAEGAASPAESTKGLTSTPPSSVQSPCHYSPLLQLKIVTSEGNPLSSNQAPRPRKLLLLGEKKEPIVWSLDEGGGSPHSSRSSECRGGGSLLDASFASPLSRSLPSSCSTALFREFADDSRFSDEPGTPPGTSISSTSAVPKAPRKSYKARPAPLRKKQPQKLFFGKGDLADQSGIADPPSSDGDMECRGMKCGSGSSLMFAGQERFPMSDSFITYSKEKGIGDARVGFSRTSGVCGSPRSPQSGTNFKEANPTSTGNYHESMPQLLSTTAGVNELSAELPMSMSWDAGFNNACDIMPSTSSAFTGIIELNALLPHTPPDKLFNSFSRTETPRAPRKLHRPVKREQDWR